jgi:hypothetical protein
VGGGQGWGGAAGTSVCDHIVPAVVEEGGEAVVIVLPELEAEEEVDLEFSVSCDGGRTFSAPCPNVLQLRYEPSYLSTLLPWCVPAAGVHA